MCSDVCLWISVELVAITVVDFGENGAIGVAAVIIVAAWTNDRIVCLLLLLLLNWHRRSVLVVCSVLLLCICSKSFV